MVTVNKAVSAFLTLLSLVDRVIDEIGEKTMEHLSVFLPVLLTFLKDNNSKVSKQSIIAGTKFFYRSLEELAFQVYFSLWMSVDLWLHLFLFSCSTYISTVTLILAHDFSYSKFSSFTSESVLLVVIVRHMSNIDFMFWYKDHIHMF